MSEKLEPYEKDYFRKILAGQANEVELSSSLQKLSKMLHEHYGKAPIIIIDEYDAPIQEGYSKSFMKKLLDLCGISFPAHSKTTGICRTVF